jgi:hypothetical protein
LQPGRFPRLYASGIASSVLGELTVEDHGLVEAVARLPMLHPRERQLALAIRTDAETVPRIKPHGRGNTHAVVERRRRDQEAYCTDTYRKTSHCPNHFC